MKADIGIIGAMEAELSDLISRLENHFSESVSGIDFHIGTLSGKSVAIAKCGIGKVFAAMCTEIMILKYSPSLIVNTGVAGAVSDGIGTGDIVIADTLCQHDMDTSPIGDPVGLISGINKIYFESDSRAVGILKTCAEEMHVNSYVGRIATGDRFIAGAEEKNRIAVTFDAAACEMEGGAVAHVAYVNSTPFAVVRAISDSADGSATEDYPTFLSKAASTSARLTLALVERY